MKYLRVLLVAIFIICILGGTRCLADKAEIKERMIVLISGGCHPDEFKEERRLCLENPDIVEEIIFEKPRYFNTRNGAFGRILFCCFKKVISTEKFMDITIRYIKNLSEIKNHTKVSEYELNSSMGAVGHFGYCIFSKQVWIELFANLTAFRQCVDKMLKYDLMFSPDIVEKLKSKITECEETLKNSKSESRMEEAIAGLESAKSLIEGQKYDIISSEAAIILPLFLNTLKTQIKDTYK